jgi:hypothetical protein
VRFTGFDTLGIENGRVVERWGGEANAQEVTQQIQAICPAGLAEFVMLP